MVAQAGSWIRMPTGFGGTPGQITGVSENAGYVLSSTSEQITLCTAAKDEGDVFKDGDKRNGSCRLQSRIRSSGDAWLNVGKTTTIAGPYLKPNTICTNNTVVSSSMAVTTAPTSGIPSGYIAAGRQHEDANRLDFALECDEGWVEVHFALAMGTGTAEDTTYEFRAKWFNDTGSVFNAVISPTLRSASSSFSSDHYLVDTATATTITASAQISAVQDLDLAHEPTAVTVTSVAQISAAQEWSLVQGEQTVLSMTSSGGITATQTLGLESPDKEVMVTSSGGITATQELSLASTDGTVAITPVAIITATQELLLSNGPPDVVVTVAAQISAAQEWSLVQGEQIVSSTTSSGALTATQTLSLANGPPDVAMTSTGALTVTQTLLLANGPPATEVTSVAQISAAQVWSLLQGEQIVLSTTSSGVLTATGDLLLASAPPGTAMTTSGALLATQVLSLAHTPPKVVMTSTGALTATGDLLLANEPPAVSVSLSAQMSSVQVRGLSDDGQIVSSMTSSGALTVTGDLLLASAPPETAVTTSGAMTATSTLLLSDTFNLGPVVGVTSSGAISTTSVLLLANTPPEVAMTSSGGITAAQVHSLAHAPPDVVVLTSTGVLASTSDALLAGGSAVVMTSTGQLTAIQVLSLEDDTSDVVMTTTGGLTATQVWGLDNSPAPVSVTVSGGITSAITLSLASSASEVVVSPGAADITSSVVGYLRQLRDDGAVVSIALSTERPPKITSVQTYSLTAADGLVTLKTSAASLTSVRHWYLIDDADPILVQPLTGFPYGPYISAATHILSVTITGIGDLDRSVDRGGVLHQRRNMFLKRSEYMAVEDIWNIGLTQLGVGLVTGQTDGSAQATLIDRVWDDFRQQFISDHAWNGCKTTAVLTALEDSDFQDSTRWQNVFSLPSDYIRALTLNGHANQPKSSEAVQWEIEIVSTKTTAVKTRCLVTNQATAKLEYVFDVGDAYIHLLSPAMRHAAGLGLAAFVGANFGKSASEIQIIEQKYREALLKAKGIDGQESSGKYFAPTELVDVRYRGG